MVPDHGDYFVQRRSNDWGEVFDRIAAALKELANPPMPPSATLEPIMAPMSPGEVLDRLAILHIKGRRIAEQAQTAVGPNRTTSLLAVREASLPHTPETGRVTADLRRVNEELWQLEDPFGPPEAAGTSDPCL